MFRKYFTRKSIGIPILFTIPSPRFFLLSILFIADNMPCEYKKTREFSRLTVLKSPSKRFLLFTFRVCSRYRCVWCSATGKEIDEKRSKWLACASTLTLREWGFRNFSTFFFSFSFSLLFLFSLPVEFDVYLLYFSIIPLVRICWSLFEAWNVEWWNFWNARNVNFYLAIVLTC